MKIYSSSNIRNVGILGQSGSGKSNMLESIEYTVGLISRISSPNDVVRSSNVTTLSSVEYQGMKYNFLDMPSYSDFYGELESGLSAIASAIVVIDSTADLSVGTEIALEITEERKIPKFIFINKVDSEKSNYSKILGQLRDKYGKKIAPFHIPWGNGENFKGHINVVDLFARRYNGKECDTVKMPEEYLEEVQEVREMLLESVAETEEELMNKFFDGIEFTTEEIHRGLRKGVLEGTLIPVICGSTYKNIGLHTTLEMVRDYLPSPIDNKKNINISEFIGQVFKTVIDPFVGKISYIKVLSGEIKNDSDIYNVNKREYEKVSKIFTISHGEMIELSKATMGDIVILTKLNSLQNSDTISKNEKQEEYISKFVEGYIDEYQKQEDTNKTEKDFKESLNKEVQKHILRLSETKIDKAINNYLEKNNLSSLEDSFGTKKQIDEAVKEEIKGKEIDM